MHREAPLTPRSPEVQGRTVLITGASRGLGRALAEALAAGGARLVLCARSGAALRDLARELGTAGTQVEWSAADVRDAAAVEGLVQSAVARFGGIDVLINNASLLGSRGPMREQPVDEWRSVLDVNVTGTFVATRAVLPIMREAGEGSIITVSSGVGNRPRAGWGAYAVSKWAVEALTYNVAEEEGPTGIRANVVDPGSMRTQMRRAAYPEEDPRAPAAPEEVTPVFLWLASAASHGVTGRRFSAQEWQPG